MFFVYIMSFSGIFSLQLASVFPARMSVFFLIQSARQRRLKFGEVAGDSSGPDTVGFLVGQDGQYMEWPWKKCVQMTKWLFHSEIAMYTSIYICIYICIYIDICRFPILCPHLSTSWRNKQQPVKRWSPKSHGSPSSPRHTCTKRPSLQTDKRPGCARFLWRFLCFRIDMEGIFSEEYGDISYDV